jgi:hypothetical protein
MTVRHITRKAVSDLTVTFFDEKREWILDGSKSIIIWPAASARRDNDLSVRPTPESDLLPAVHKKEDASLLTVKAVGLALLPLLFGTANNRSASDEHCTSERTT